MNGRLGRSQMRRWIGGGLLGLEAAAGMARAAVSDVTGRSYQWTFDGTQLERGSRVSLRKALVGQRHRCKMLRQFQRNPW